MTIVKIKFTFISLSAVQNMIYFVSNQSTIKVSQRDIKKKMKGSLLVKIFDFAPLIKKRKSQPTISISVNWMMRLS